jgi:hypothetical protein
MEQKRGEHKGDQAENPLVMWLREQGHVGERRAIGRKDVARRMGVTVREVTGWGNSSREGAADGRFGNVVCFSKKGKEGGLFLAANDDELLEVGYRLRREGFTLMKQLKAVKRALSIQGNQQKLYKGIEQLMEVMPDELPEEDAENDPGDAKQPG